MFRRAESILVEDLLHNNDTIDLEVKSLKVIEEKTAENDLVLSRANNHDSKDGRDNKYYDDDDDNMRIIDEMRKLNSNTSTSLPYKSDKCYSRLKYYFETFVVTNPRLLSIYLLYKSIWPRIFAIVDMYTDIQITIDLYKSEENYRLLFGLSLLFISFSFVILWSVSLRFIDNFIQETNNSLNIIFKNNENKVIKQFKKTISILMTIFVYLYLFPPFGCVLVSFYEIYYLLSDVWLGIYSFFKGEILIIDKQDSQRTAFKQFRRIVEFFGESIPQLALQSYMAFNGIQVDPFDLTISLVVSFIHLVYNLYKLRKEAKYHGMTFEQYSIAVLHLGMHEWVCTVYCGASNKQNPDQSAINISSVVVYFLFVFCFLVQVQFLSHNSYHVCQQLQKEK